MKRIRWFVQSHWQLMLLVGAIYALWSTDLVWPFKVLIVLFHELAHAAVALLTGGEVHELSINRRQGGFVLFSGGPYLWTAAAGYLGSLMIGAILMLGAVKTHFDRAIMIGLGAIMIVTVLLYVRDGFAILFMSLIGLAFVAVGYWLPLQVSDLILRVIGLTSMLYVPWDIATDTLFTANRMSLQVSDAAAVAHQLGLTEKIVGFLWILLSLAVIVLVGFWTLRAPSNIAITGHDSR